VFSKTAAYRHASIEPGVAALERMATENDVGLVTTEDADVFQAGSLAVYDAVVFLSTTGDILNDDQQLALMSYIRGGGGFVGIHSATDTEYDWAWYGQLVGGYFERHPNNPSVREGTVSVAGPEHPATAGLPNPWIRSDEWYEIRDLQPDLVPLLTIDESSYKAPGENPSASPRPISWFHEFDGGRAFYTALGHTSESFEEPLFLDHVWGGLRYAMNK
jgi:type 1 glutamine amidotransferase